MSEIFANFSAAITLDSDQGAFGFSEIDLLDDCSSGGFCRGVASAEKMIGLRHGNLLDTRWRVGASNRSDFPEGMDTH